MKTPATRPLQFSAVAACAVLGACGKSGPTQPRVATILEVVGGSNQVAPVGSSLPVKILVKTSDAQGPVGGTVVATTTESQGGGYTSPTSVTTAANGQAEITWTLGSKLGTQVLTLSSGSIPAVSVSATGQVGAASTIFPVSDAFQLTVVKRAVSTPPSVRVTDEFSNPVSGVSVTFDAPVAGSILTGTAAVTNASGIATIGSWTIGPDAIGYQVRASITAGPAAGVATGFEARGVPATVVAVSGIGQTGNTGTALAQAPAVRAARDDGSPLPSVTVTFVVTGGGGTIQGATGVTGLDGIARAGGWTLGTTPGSNQVDAQVLGVPPVTFTATGILGVPAVLTAVSPTTQSGFLGNFVGAPPVVAVTDAQARPVAGATVTFELLQADGQITGANQLTDALGRARPDAWRLGSGASEGLRAVAGALPPVTFTVNAGTPPPSTFNLEVRFRSTADGCTTCHAPTTSQLAAFTQATARWKQIILAGEAPYPVNEPASGCFPAMNEAVNGLVIFISLVPIDGVNNILGQSGPCIVRDDHKFQPAVGLMELDVADLDADEARNQLADVVLHEMGHVLGFGTMWNFDPGPPFTGPGNPPNAFLLGEGGQDPTFNGASARAAFFAAAMPGHAFTGVPVPVENHGGPGTAGSHWREPMLNPELMTGFISPQGTPNLLSAITVGSLRDLGYVVNDAVADSFTFLAALQGAPSLLGPAPAREGVLPYPIIVIDRHGRHVTTVPRNFK